jgi:hypothetical protein
MINNVALRTSPNEKARRHGLFHRIEGENYSSSGFVRTASRRRTCGNFAGRGTRIVSWPARRPNGKRICAPGASTATGSFTATRRRPRPPARDRRGMEGDRARTNRCGATRTQTAESADRGPTTSLRTSPGRYRMCNSGLLLSESAFLTSPCTVSTTTGSNASRVSAPSVTSTAGT